MKSSEASNAKALFFRFQESHQNKIIDLTRNTKCSGESSKLSKDADAPQSITAIEEQVIKEKLVKPKKTEPRRRTDPFFVKEIPYTLNYRSYYEPCMDPKLSLFTTGPNANLFFSFRAEECKVDSGEIVRKVITEARPFMSQEGEDVFYENFFIIELFTY